MIDVYAAFQFDSSALMTVEGCHAGMLQLNCCLVCLTGAGMLMSSALFRQASYDDVVNWIWSLGDISSGGMLCTHIACTCCAIYTQHSAAPCTTLEACQALRTPQCHDLYT